MAIIKPMKYKYEEFCSVLSLITFLNEHAIKPECIIKIFQDSRYFYLIYLGEA